MQKLKPGEYWADRPGEFYNKSPIEILKKDGKLFVKYFEGGGLPISLENCAADAIYTERLNGKSLPLFGSTEPKGKQTPKPKLDLNYEAIQWVQAKFKPKSISPLASSVIALLDKMWGIHNYEKYGNLKKTDWANTHHIIVRYNQVLSTVDPNGLTCLIVLCHKMMLRLELTGKAASNKGYLELMFHQRVTRDRSKGFSCWCPTIEDHIKIIKGA